MTWTEGDVVIDGVRIHHYRRGQGPPVVLAHGSMDSGPCWNRVAGALETDFELIAYDARSHGLSDASEEWGDGGRDMIALVEALGIERPAAMGHSMGVSATAAAIAARPDLFRAAVLEDPPWMPEATKDDWKARARMQQSFLAMLDGTKDEIAARGRKYNPMWHPDEFDAWAESKTQFRPPESWTKRFTQQRPPWQDPVKKFECPVLARARRQRLARPHRVTEDCRRSAGDPPRVREVVTLDEAGHNVRREAYDDDVAAVPPFLLRNS